VSDSDSSDPYRHTYPWPYEQHPDGTDPWRIASSPCHARWGGSTTAARGGRAYRRMHRPTQPTCVAGPCRPWTGSGTLAVALVWPAVRCWLAARRTLSESVTWCRVAARAFLVRGGPSNDDGKRKIGSALAWARQIPVLAINVGSWAQSATLWADLSPEMHCAPLLPRWIWARKAHAGVPLIVFNAGLRDTSLAGLAGRAWRGQLYRSRASRCRCCPAGLQPLRVVRPGPLCVRAAAKSSWPVAAATTERCSEAG
jgi:hypothetical protein